MIDRGGLSFKKGYVGRSIFKICNTIFLILVMAMMIVPILKIVSDSFDATTQYGINLIPVKFTLQAYHMIFTNQELYTPFLISVYTTVVGTAIGLLLTTLGAYVLIQKDLPGRKFFSWMIFFTMIFSGGLIPTFLLIRNLHLINSLWSVILPLSINVYNTVLMKSFFEQLPQSLMEAAEVDGCTPMRIFVSIVLPLSKPALASIGLFFAVEYWNHFFNFIMYINDPNKYNFQIKIRELVLSSTELSNARMEGSYVAFKTVQSAVIITAMIPFMIIYPFCQRYFVQGVTVGAVKE